MQKTFSIYGSIQEIRVFKDKGYAFVRSVEVKGDKGYAFVRSVEVKDDKSYAFVRSVEMRSKVIKSTVSSGQLRSKVTGSYEFRCFFIFSRSDVLSSYALLKKIMASIRNVNLFILMCSLIYFMKHSRSPYIECEGTVLCRGIGM